MRHLARFHQDNVLSLVTGFRISHFLLTCPLFIRPHGFNVGNDIHDIRFRELISKCWHGIEICWISEADTTFKNVTNEQSIPVMPGVAGFVVGGRA